MSQADIVEAMREADVLVPTITDQINAAMVAQAGEQMRLIANFGNGVDHIDVTKRAPSRDHGHQHAWRPD